MEALRGYREGKQSLEYLCVLLLLSQERVSLATVGCLSEVYQAVDRPYRLQRVTADQGHVESWLLLAYWKIMTFALQ